ncbi:MAG TPA: hypothetical protein VK149_04160 [Sideroxyarcus sp.]|nr:hypothetical protein [Sideroxyarcus sp.]
MSELETLAAAIRHDLETVSDDLHGPFLRGFRIAHVRTLQMIEALQLGAELPTREKELHRVATEPVAEGDWQLNPGEAHD